MVSFKKIKFIKIVPYLIFTIAFLVSVGIFFSDKADAQIGNDEESVTSYSQLAAACSSSAGYFCSGPVIRNGGTSIAIAVQGLLKIVLMAVLVVLVILPPLHHRLQLVLIMDTHVIMEILVLPQVQIIAVTQFLGVIELLG